MKADIIAKQAPSDTDSAQLNHILSSKDLE